MNQALTLFSYERIIGCTQPILVCAGKKIGLLSKAKNNALIEGIKLSSWRQMIKELTEAGYSAHKISKLTGIPSQQISQWFNSDEEFADLAVFSEVLYLYCHYKLDLRKQVPPYNWMCAKRKKGKHYEK